MPTPPGPAAAVRARAKLTRSLRVVGRRDDGYHLLDAEMVSLDLADDLVIVPGAPTRLEVRDEIAWSAGTGVGAAVPSGHENLVLKALSLAGREASVTLTKRIPPGSGLGGGSADAAAVLRWAGVEDPDIAARLGADVPFCLSGGRARVEGVGEHLTPLAPLALDVVLCIPALAVSTAAVYRAFDDPTTPRATGANDLEPAALRVAPQLALWRDAFGAAARRPPSLAGSGATWFVECDGADAARLAAEVAASVAAKGLSAVVIRCRSEGALEQGRGRARTTP